VALGAQVVDLVGLHLAQDAGQVGGVGQVAVVKVEAGLIGVGVHIEMIDPLGVEGGGAALDAVDLIALLQQEFSQVGTVLAGDAGDEGALGHDAVS
jgi:hypothetical protein